MPRPFLKLLLLTALACVSEAPQIPPQPAPTLTSQASGTEQLLQAVSVVSESVVWVSGHGGSYARTLDGGLTWQAARVPQADTLQFRDVHAISADTALLLAAGPADMSRIYRTTDGGTTWNLAWQNEDPNGFWDCFDFWDSRRGAAYGDETGGVLAILTTSDGGASWSRVPADSLPAAQEGEGGFAASGLCLVAGPAGRGWITTGAADTSRILETTNFGASWRAVSTPAFATDAAGLMAISFRNDLVGIAVGGDIREPEGYSDNVVVTGDGGLTWELAGRPVTPGALYGGTYLPGTAWVVGVGPSGADYSVDDGATWTVLDTLSYWSVGFASAKVGWMTGPGGRITRVEMY